MNEVNNLLSEAANFDSFEAFENYVANTRPDLYNKVMAQAGSMRKRSLAPMRTAANVPALGRVGVQPSKNTPSSAATFTIQAKRITNTIPAALPVPIFGYLGIENSYVDFTGSFLPPNTVLEVTFDGTSGTLGNRVNLTYTQGAASDVVELTCNEINYKAFLKATGITKMVVNKIRYDISDTTKVNQFSQNFQVSAKDLMGKFSSENITPSNFKSPEQFQSGIVDLDINVQIKPEACFLLNMGHTNGDNFIVTLTHFVSILDKVV